MSSEPKIFHSLNCSLCKAPYPRSPIFLRELLNDPSIIESPNGNGWLLSEPITNPLKCSTCDVKFHFWPGSGWFWMKCSICNDSVPGRKSIETRDNWLREFLRELPELIEQIPKVKEIRIKSTLDSYREKFAKMNQELEEKFRAFEESLNKANGTI
ncbi:unnamed protein product, partial [Mesorhabditis belari]|uniref:Uncharacterized protein n=1 Tax=Mesorhabditis belari TaxID=2138241 RepID=A0AAF3EHG8_9BILA